VNGHGHGVGKVDASLAKLMQVVRMRQTVTDSEMELGVGISGEIPDAPQISPCLALLASAAKVAFVTAL